MYQSLSSVCYIYDANFLDLKEVHETGAGEERVESI